MKTARAAVMRVTTNRRGLLSYQGHAWEKLSYVDRDRALRKCFRLKLEDLRVIDVACALRAKGKDGRISKDVVLGHMFRNGIEFPGKAAKIRRKAWAHKKARERALSSSRKRN